MREITDSNIDEVFTYHAPDANAIADMQALRNAAKAYAQTVLDVCPRVPDRTRCLNMIKDSNMLANAAIILQDVE